LRHSVDVHTCEHVNKYYDEKADQLGRETMNIYSHDLQQMLSF